MNKVKKLSVSLTIGGERIVLSPPKMSALYLMAEMSPTQAAELFTGFKLSETDSLMVCEAVSRVVEDAVNRPELAVPYYPDKQEQIPYELFTGGEKLIAEYSGLSVPEVCELDIYDFRMLLRDAVIYNKIQTETGRKWLRDAYRITQTVPDMDKLRKKFDIKKRVISDGVEEKCED
jgi:hypothetical protein